MAYDPDYEERQELLDDNWMPFAGSNFKKVTQEGTFWIGVPSGSRNRKYNVELSHEGTADRLGSATTLKGALRLVKKKLRALSAPVRVAPSRLLRTKRRVGRTTVSIDWLQEKLDEEVLRGALITLDGENYRVGNFIGDRVELWRE